MALIPPINTYVASQQVVQQARPVTPPAFVAATAKPPTPPERRERMRDKEKRHRKAEREAQQDILTEDPRGVLTDVEA